MVKVLNDGNKDLTDVYIINSVSHNIFYVAGITYEGKTYYTQYQDDEHVKNGTNSINQQIQSEIDNAINEKNNAE